MRRYFFRRASAISGSSTGDGAGMKIMRGCGLGPDDVVARVSDRRLLTALVQQGIGFNAERGDVVKVVNAPFRVDAPPAAEDLPLWKQPWLLDLLKTAMAPLALLVVALLIISKLVKPAMTQLMAPPPAPEPGEQVSEVVGGDDADKPLETLPALAAPQHNSKLEAARALAKQNPAAVANIVRGWVNGEAA